MARFAVTYIGPPNGYGNRGLTKMYIAIHNTSNDATPVGEAGWAKQRPDKTSSHFYADDSTVIQSLDTKYDANHAGSGTGNGRAIAFELVGTNGSSEAHWRKVIDKVAPVIAAVCKTHNIGVRHLTVAEAKAGKLSGFVTHDDMRRAWGGTTHTDPGPNFPMAYLLARVNAYLSPTPKPPTSIPAKPTPAKPPTHSTDWSDSLIMSLPTISKGDKGQPVKVVQGLLNANGAYLTIDGDAGSATDKAIRDFQRKEKLTVDGKFGQNSYVKALK